ncbi:MAG: NAD(P)H-dependent oxidoreductase [Agarilytica sp.]|jgi:FMN-dependent NADH-azoreductase
MQNVLILNSSPTPDDSVSTRFTAFFEQELLSSGRYNFVTRDLGAHPPEHLNALALSGFFIDPSEHTSEQIQALSESTCLIKELKNSDLIIIGAAMHNHTVTSGLKAYIDLVTRPGLTFEYGAEGPRGFLNGKKVFVVISAGGEYSSEVAKKSDFVTPLLKEVLGFIGLNDITFIPVFGTYADNGIFEQYKNSARRLIKTEVRKLKEL